MYRIKALKASIATLLAFAMALLLLVPGGVGRQAEAASSGVARSAPQESGSGQTQVQGVPAPGSPAHDPAGNVYPYLVVQTTMIAQSFTFNAYTDAFRDQKIDSWRWRNAGSTILWGDGQTTQVGTRNGTDVDFGTLTHTYAQPGNHTVTIEPGAEGFYCIETVPAGASGLYVASPFMNEQRVAAVGGDWSLIYPAGLVDSEGQNLNQDGLFANLFAGCDSLETIEADFRISAHAAGVSQVGSFFCALMFPSNPTLAFASGCKFTLPQSLTSVGSYFCEGMFEDNGGASFALPAGFNLPQRLVSVGQDFCCDMCEDCSGDAFTMPAGFNLPQGLTTVPAAFCAGMFDGCRGAAFNMSTGFNLPQKLTSVGVGFCSAMFEECQGAAFTMSAGFNLPQGLTKVPASFCAGMFTASSGYTFTMSAGFNLPQKLTSVGANFCNEMFADCSVYRYGGVYNQAFNLSKGFTLPPRLVSAAASTDSAQPQNFCIQMFDGDYLPLTPYQPNKTYTATFNDDWGTDGSITIKFLSADAGSGWSVASGVSGHYAAIRGVAPNSGFVNIQVNGSYTANPALGFGQVTYYTQPQPPLKVPTIGGGIDTASVKTPAAVVMGGAGSTYSTANDGQGVQLSLTTPVVTSDGGATVTQKGWLISKATSKPATSTLGARSYNTAYWQPFNPSTYMTLGDNGKYLVYYAKNSVGYGYSNEVKVSVSADYPYPEVGGTNRLATSALTALDAWPTGVSKAVFASGAEFYDAECANYLAGALGCPILLVSATTSSNAPIKQAVAKLGIKSAYVVGGNCTASMMRSVGFSHYARVSSGRDGATDAVQVLQYVVSHKLEAKPSSLLLSTTSGFADALGASSYSATKALNLPILFVNGLNDASKAASEVKSLGSIKSLYVLGSTGAVSASAAKKVQSSCAKGVKATRLWGSDRNQTAAAVFASFAPKVATLNASKHLDSIGVAAGNNYPDALGAGAAQAHLGGAVLITPATSVAPWISRELTGGTITISGSKATYKLASLVKTLTNFEFYGQTISLKVRDSISKYVR
jgi:putative cell wall-binding protein